MRVMVRVIDFRNAVPFSLRSNMRGTKFIALHTYSTFGHDMDIHALYIRTCLDRRCFCVPCSTSPRCVLLLWVCMYIHTLYPILVTHAFEMVGWNLMGPFASSRCLFITYQVPFPMARSGTSTCHIRIYRCNNLTLETRLLPQMPKKNLINFFRIKASTISSTIPSVDKLVSGISTFTLSTLFKC